MDLLVLLYLSIRLLPSVPPDAVHTELRTSYINLDVLYSKGIVNSSYHAPIVNHAFSFVQVSLKDPKKVLPTYHTRFFERRFGPVPLLESRFLVTPEVCFHCANRLIVTHWCRHERSPPLHNLERSTLGWSHAAWLSVYLLLTKQMDKLCSHRRSRLTYIPYPSKRDSIYKPFHTLRCRRRKRCLHVWRSRRALLSRHQSFHAVHSPIIHFSWHVLTQTAALI